MNEKIHCITDKNGIKHYAIKRDHYSLSRITRKWRPDPPLATQDAAFIQEYRFNTFCEAMGFLYELPLGNGK